MDRIGSFEDWISRANLLHGGDRIWRMNAYRLAIYALEIAWSDAVALDRNRITRPIGSQLYRAIGSIGGNIAEGYSRSSGADRARFFEYALGSTRESAVWHWAARPVLGERLHDSRVELLSHIRRILLAAIPASAFGDLKRGVATERIPET